MKPAITLNGKPIPQDYDDELTEQEQQQVDQATD